MKISVKNFKAISEISQYHISQINILAGMNSGGKSSLIQLLLLIKQTLETRSAESPLKLNRPYVSLGKFENILRKGSGDDAFGFSVELDAKELTPRLRRIRTGSDKTQGSIHITEKFILAVEFKRSSDRIVVDKFSVVLCDSENKDIYLRYLRNPHGKSYRLESNAADVFFENSGLPPLIQIESIQVFFHAFFPEYISIGDYEYLSSYLLNQARLSLQRIFSKMSYIGPLREEPKSFYFQDDELIEHIGNKGENAAYILAKHAKEKIRYARYSFDESGRPTGEYVSGTFQEAVNHWMCEVFGLAKGVKVETSKGNRYLYTVSLVNKDGSKIPITHVGFGVSQIFPILVEGLRPGQHGRLIILEQPEIHLHPRVQSWLFDFVASVANGVSFLIETHSDHLITRLRRRIAETSTDSLLNMINLTFVEPVLGGVEYSRLTLNEIGSIDCWPEGFFDQHESDVRALVKAQAAKRRGHRNDI